jgi:uncharacterized protein HemY
VKLAAFLVIVVLAVAGIVWLARSIANMPDDEGWGGDE